MFIDNFCSAVGRNGDARFHALVSFLCELAGVTSLTSNYLPSLVAASAVSIASSLVDCNQHSMEVDLHPPPLVDLCGYTFDQTVRQAGSKFVHLCWEPARVRNAGCVPLRMNSKCRVFL